ncbi:hypothetical protein EHS25_010075 [Saitozyma podzolica]|uniref:Uncharacterized protein n=1 Tax=Saitozyma podzolica TaxID=1890683 RepID=A0A427YIK0_9TREE|nr:hypothetical protein EHS25_010075 [Saitozyma podzolica]
MADREFVDSREDVAYTNNSAQEDQRNAESERTGTVPRSEVEDLKDSLGGGETVDEYTRPSNKEQHPGQIDNMLDEAIEGQE